MKKKKKVDVLTEFLGAMAEKAEKSGHGIYDVIANNEELKKLRALDEDGDEKIRAAVKMFVSQSFNDMLTSICMQIALLLLEIKNQKDSFENDGTAPDIVKLESMGGDAAEKFKILTDVLKKSAASVDWDYVADRIINYGKSDKATKSDDAGPFSVN